MPSVVAASASLYMNVIECDSKLMKPDILSAKDGGGGEKGLVLQHHPSIVRVKNVKAIRNAPSIRIAGNGNIFSYAKSVNVKGKKEYAEALKEHG